MPDELSPIPAPQTAFSDAAQDSLTPPPVQSTVQPPSPPAEAPAPPMPEAPPPPAGPSPFFERAKSFGIDVSQYASDQDLGAALLNQLQTVYAQQYQRQQPQPEPQPPAHPQPEEWSIDTHFKKSYPIPEYSPNWDTMISSGYIDRDPRTGQWVPTPGNEWLRANPDLNALNAHEKSRAEWVRSLYDGNFYGNLWKVFEEPIQRMIDSRSQEQVTSVLSQERASSSIDAFERQHQAWLYDQSGKPTPDGQRFFDAITLIRDVDTPEKLLAAAAKLAGPQPAAAPVVSPAASQGSVEPRVPDAKAVSAQKAQSFLDESLQRAKHSPSSGTAPVQHPDHESNYVTRTELDSLFINAAKAQAAAV